MGTLTPEALERALRYFVAMLLSLTVHEAAHALVARLKGDMTASLAGRLSLNPLRHIDPFGTVVLPLVGALTQMPIIGWAKPVPVDLRQLKHPRWDHLQIAAAGPLSNFLLAGLCVGLLGFITTGQAGKMLLALVWVNAYLGVFNLLPLPPLDGGAVALAALPPRVAAPYRRYVAPYGFMILFGLLAAHALDWMPGLAQSYVSMVARIFGP